MPKNSFSNFHRKSALQKEKPEPDERVVDTSDVDEETYRDISAFPDNIVTQITFRLSILRYLARLTKKLIDLIPVVGVKLIIIDEFQHLVEEKSNRVLTQVGNWLKMILNRTKCPIVLFGMPYSKVVLKENSQLHGRFSIQFELRPFSYQGGEGIFKAFLSHLDRALPFDKEIGLANEDLQKKLYAFSQGNMRSLRNLIYHASVEAIDNNHDTITLEDFVFASELTSGDKLSTWTNPFGEDVKITDQMLRPPPKDIGWEDYLRSSTPKIRNSGGNKNFFE
ncbi:hypothetical protein CGJ34_08475 [Vibrio parahaemolyticus]|uniref:TniB family NTP-binding protein n=1 Tax=Vibrio parahaemolyticus TaxID=670 RepID=UPI00111CBE42|nr:TniB family NTP-binding protein [Vibrio parahaemolyticus]TOE84576.1 hypothetical protein CGJ34_08475 [Vibrio parahaemolyticus]